MWPSFVALGSPGSLGGGVRVPAGWRMLAGFLVGGVSSVVGWMQEGAGVGVVLVLRGVGGGVVIYYNIINRDIIGVNIVINKVLSIANMFAFYKKKEVKQFAV